MTNAAGRRTSSATPVLLLALGLVLGVGACASAGTGGASSSDGDLTQADFVGVGSTNALEVVEELRPRWLRARPSRTPGNPVPVVGVVIDGRPGGSIDELRGVALSRVERISFMSSSDATTRYGTGYGGGAIVVTIIKG